MLVQESSATALVRFTGLGILGFNEDKRRGEIAAIRDNKHLLTVRIQRPFFQEGSGDDIVVYRDIAVYEKLPKEDVQIEIKALGKSAIDGYEIYQSGDFDRLNSADSSDFGWIVNMSSLHKETGLVGSTEERYPLSRINISNGLFYTHKLNTHLCFERLETEPSGNVARTEVFGNVAETIGVKIEGEKVSFRIRVDGEDHSHVLKRIDGLPFRIDIRNMDYSDDAVYSDMADYYKYVASPTGTRYDLRPIVDSGAARGMAVNQDDFCHPIIVDWPWPWPSGVTEAIVDNSGVARGKAVNTMDFCHPIIVDWPWPSGVTEATGDNSGTARGTAVNQIEFCHPIIVDWPWPV